MRTYTGDFTFYFTGNQELDMMNAPQPQRLPVWFHLIFLILTFATTGLALPIWALISLLHYMLVYRQSKRRVEMWREAYTKFYTPGGKL